MTDRFDPVELSIELLRCASVTPVDAGSLDVLQEFLEPLGFECRRMTFSEPGTPDVDNLYARFGTIAPNFCFAGHTDVVPPGNIADWNSDPFKPEIRDGLLYGRGVSDMKGAIASFCAAAARYITSAPDHFKGSISLMITGDEEGPSINGTRKMLGWLKDRGETIDHCLVGEPTNPDQLGEMVKIGRRGSLNGHIRVKGRQGHSAYPQLADNPLPRLVKFLNHLSETPLDDGSEHFPPTTLALTSVDVGNTATNIIPARGEAKFNIRFNDHHTGESLTKKLQQWRDEIAGDSELNIRVSGEAFLTPPGLLSDILSQAIKDVCGRVPELSTTGGTSDARFIKNICPVSEFGLTNRTAHMVDECARVSDIHQLSTIYEKTLMFYFKRMNEHNN